MATSKILFLALGASSLMALEARAADCGPLKLVNTVQMERDGANIDSVPIRINGVEQQFVFDTGGFTTSISRDAAEKLKLPIRPSYMEMVNVAGGSTSDAASITEFTIGRLHGEKATFPMAPFKGIDGIFSLNFMRPYDVDVDFGTDKLNFFSQDHCPGAVVYWKTDVVEAIPFKISAGHIFVPVTLDGNRLQAMVDTGATRTTLRLDLARSFYRLTLGDDETPQLEAGENPDPKSPKVYKHVFKTLSFGAIDVNNPAAMILEDVWKRDAGHAQLVGNRSKTEQDITALLPELVLGMNVMRKLHIYFAFGENKMYISLASVAGASVVK